MPLESWNGPMPQLLLYPSYWVFSRKAGRAGRPETCLRSSKVGADAIHVDVLAHQAIVLLVILECIKYHGRVGRFIGVNRIYVALLALELGMVLFATPLQGLFDEKSSLNGAMSCAYSVSDCFGQGPPCGWLEDAHRHVEVRVVI